MSRTLARNLLIAITIIWALMIVPCSGLAIFTVFLTDSGTINPDIFAMIFFGSLSFPAAIVIFTPIAWIIFYFQKNPIALIVSLIPMLVLAVPLIGFMLLFGLQG